MLPPLPEMYVPCHHQERIAPVCLRRSRPGQRLSCHPMQTKPGGNPSYCQTSQGYRDILLDDRGGAPGGMQSLRQVLRQAMELWLQGKSRGVRGLSRGRGALTAMLFACKPPGWPSAIAKAELWSLKPKTRGTYCSGGRWGRTEG